MKHKLTLLMLCLFSVLSLEAQTNRASVSGKILDNTTKAPVEQAAIRVLSLPDSTFVTGISSKKDGSFSIPSLKKGRYLMKVTFVGYSVLTKYFQLTSAKPSVNFGEISMKPDAVMLKGATVTAEAPPVTVKEDTMVYNASAYRVPEGSMLEDLVKKIPGAEVGTDGSITVNGKQIKKIMVDGKEFFSSDPKVAMKNLPVNMVENVKTYDRKSDLARITGIDDGDEETVLDLTVKKGMKKGLIGNLIAGTGSQSRYETGAMASQFKDNSQFTVVGSANNTNNQGFSEFGDAGQGMSGNAGAGINASKSIGMNFAKSTDKLEVGGNIKYGKSDKDARMKSSTENFLGQESSFGTAENASRRFRDDVNGDFRLEWRPDTLTNIIFRPNISYSHTNSFSNGVSATFNNSHASVNDRKSKSDGVSNYLSLGGNLQINRKLNNKGRSITLRAESGYNKKNSDNYSYSKTVYYNLNDSTNLDQYMDNDGNSYNYKLQMIYVEPIFTKRFLQFRYSFQNSYSASDKYTYNNVVNWDAYDTDFRTKNYNKDYVDSLSNSLGNRYMTHQFELSLRTIRTKYMYNIGFSLEPQTSKSNTTVGPNKGKDISQNVLNFSPTFDFHYRFSKQEQLRIMYRGRSSAPDINNLQTVIDKTDPLNVRNGNPDLKPSYSNRFMLFFNNYMQESQRSVMMHLSFNNTLNSVASKRTYDATKGAWISNLVNVNGNWNTQGFLSFNTPLSNKKFTLSTFSNASFSDAVSFTSLNNNASNAQKSTTHNLNLGQKITGNYRSDLFDFSLNGAINYSLAKNNMQTKSNRETFNYLLGANTNINLPWNIFLSSDVNYNIKSGYTGDYQKTEVLWNAQLSKNFLAKNNATIRFKIYDILHQQSNLSRTISEGMMQDIEYNTLGSYFMVHFVYRFNTLGGKSPRSRRFGPDDHGPGYGPRDRHQGGERPPMGAPGGGPGMM